MIGYGRNSFTRFGYEAFQKLSECTVLADGAEHSAFLSVPAHPFLLPFRIDVYADVEAVEVVVVAEFLAAAGQRGCECRSCCDEDGRTQGLMQCAEHSGHHLAPPFLKSQSPNLHASANLSFSGPR